MTQYDRINEIHESLVNGQRQQMVRQIDEYGSEFWADYWAYLANTYVNQSSAFSYFKDATISYFRIKAR